jgi:hypothetical protein
MTDKQKSITGGCQCGAVTYEAKGDPAMVIQCHCLNCQKSSGTGHVPFAGFPEPQVTVEGKTNTFSYIADSGGTVTSHFCPECGSTIFGKTTSFPQMMAIRLGSMDDSSAFQPQMEVYMKRLRKWDHDLQGVPSFEAMPPMQR